MLLEILSVILLSRLFSCLTLNTKHMPPFITTYLLNTIYELLC